MFLKDGMTRKSIADTLKAEGVLTPYKKGCNWTVNNIEAILINEKYKGDALLQKVYCEDYLEHKIKKNDGVLLKYYVENSHPGITEKEEWTLVQEELKRRANRKYAYQNANPYLGKLICDDCGHFFGIKIFHSTDKYKKKVLVCNGKYKCDWHSPKLDPEDVNQRFVEAYNKVMNNKETLIEDTKAIIQLLTDTSDLDDKIQKLNTEMEETELLVENLIHDNAKRPQSQEDYEKHYNEFVEKFEKTKDKAERLIEEQAAKINKKDVLEAFIKTIEAKENIIDKFSVDLWNLMIQEAIVHPDKTITFKFKNGKEITI